MLVNYYFFFFYSLIYSGSTPSNLLKGFSILKDHCIIAQFNAGYLI